MKPKIKAEPVETPVQDEAAVAVETETVETPAQETADVVEEPATEVAEQPKKRRDTSNSPSNKKRAANKSKSEVK